MTRLLGFLIVVMVAVTPTADVVCRALCTPVAATALPSCHDDGEVPAGGVVAPASSCQPTTAAALAAIDTRRSPSTPSAHQAAPASTVPSQPMTVRGPAPRQDVRPRPPQACPSTIVLRI